MVWVAVIVSVFLEISGSKFDGEVLMILAVSGHEPFKRDYVRALTYGVHQFSHVVRRDNVVIIDKAEILAIAAVDQKVSLRSCRHASTRFIDLNLNLTKKYFNLW